jgi:hypothetical protein
VEECQLLTAKEDKLLVVLSSHHNVEVYIGIKWFGATTVNQCRYLTVIDLCTQILAHCLASYCDLATVLRNYQVKLCLLLHQIL